LPGLFPNKAVRSTRLRTWKVEVSTISNSLLLVLGTTRRVPSAFSVRLRKARTLRMRALSALRVKSTTDTLWPFRLPINAKRPFGEIAAPLGLTPACAVPTRLPLTSYSKICGEGPSVRMKPSKVLGDDANTVAEATPVLLAELESV